RAGSCSTCSPTASIAFGTIAASKATPTSSGLGPDGKGVVTASLNGMARILPVEPWVSLPDTSDCRYERVQTRAGLRDKPGVQEGLRVQVADNLGRCLSLRRAPYIIVHLVRIDLVEFSAEHSAPPPDDKLVEQDAEDQNDICERVAIGEIVEVLRR